tara:strand:- start:25605 stop:26249 length:645 start_codon:yes stop_codon:yes gene_type:complete
MDLQHIDPADLRPNPWNTNSVPPDAQEKLKASLERHGWIKPVLARRNGAGLEILGGQHRVEAAKDLGHETVPVLVLENVTDVRAKEIGLIDNARYGEDNANDLAKLMEELGGVMEMSQFLPIGDAEIAALSTEFDDDIIENLLEDKADEKDKEEPAPKATRTHQIMRFKVPIEDADQVKDKFDKIMEDQGFTEGDSLSNVGDALVWLMKDDQDD